jgi:ACR3 family arsenite efflux pump ArsB
MDKQKLRYTKYDLFLLFLAGLLAGILTGIFIIMLSVKEIDKILPLLVVILPLLAGVVTVIYQMERQHKDNYLLQLEDVPDVVEG